MTDLEGNSTNSDSLQDKIQERKRVLTNILKNHKAFYYVLENLNSFVNAVEDILHEDDAIKRKKRAKEMINRKEIKDSSYARFLVSTIGYGIEKRLDSQLKKDSEEFIQALKEYEPVSQEPKTDIEILAELDANERAINYVRDHFDYIDNVIEGKIEYDYKRERKFELLKERVKDSAIAKIFVYAIAGYGIEEIEQAVDREKNREAVRKTAKFIDFVRGEVRQLRDEMIFVEDSFEELHEKYSNNGSPK